MGASAEYVPDRLCQRLFQPWTLPKDEHPLCREDWRRVDAICDAVEWHGMIMDFGCGDGTLAAMVCSRNPSVWRVDGFDLDANQVRKARGMWTQWPAKFQHVTAVAGVPAGIYDGALCCEVLEHVDEAKGLDILQQIRGVLKPGGALLVTVPNGIGARADYPGHVRTFDRVSLAESVKRAGFVVTAFDIPRLPFDWLGVVARA